MSHAHTCAHGYTNLSRHVVVVLGDNFFDVSTKYALIYKFIILLQVNVGFSRNQSEDPVEECLSLVRVVI